MIIWGLENELLYSTTSSKVVRSLGGREYYSSQSTGYDLDNKQLQDNIISAHKDTTSVCDDMLGVYNSTTYVAHKYT